MLKKGHQDELLVAGTALRQHPLRNLIGRTGQAEFDLLLPEPAERRCPGSNACSASWRRSETERSGRPAEHIPLGSRIIIAADTCHAITSDRPDRAARSHSDAVEELTRCAGTQFDLASRRR